MINVFSSLPVQIFLKNTIFGFVKMLNSGIRFDSFF